MARELRGENEKGLLGNWLHLYYHIIRGGILIRSRSWWRRQHPKEKKNNCPDENHKNKSGRCTGPATTCPVRCKKSNVRSGTVRSVPVRTNMFRSGPALLSVGPVWSGNCFLWSGSKTCSLAWSIAFSPQTGQVQPGFSPIFYRNTHRTGPLTRPDTGPAPKCPGPACSCAKIVVPVIPVILPVGAVRSLLLVALVRSGPVHMFSGPGPVWCSKSGLCADTSK